ncbi:hypothetical protein JTE90_004076 [Oedothorax gibbosus]|uniref:RRM domain-containing protein n=1 Tax=Oedothorax gibbosus TaxID=931172 RepID=A0AAV6TTA6_9ARAC|nr:hypothetical protein JTE90_004076 [Oedothorax gibbosus]
MESINSSSEFPNGTPNNQFTDSNSIKTWAPKSRPVPSDRKHGKKREHSPEKEWSEGKSLKRRNPDNSRDDEGIDKPKKDLNINMESINSSSEFPNGTPNNQFTDSNSIKRWAPKSRPVPSDRKHGKKREHSPEKEWSKSKSPTGRNPDNSRDDEGIDKLKEELQFQPTEQPPISIHAASTSTYSTNGYATSDYYAVDPNQNNYMMPQYNMYNTINQFDASVSSGMPPMDMTSPSTGMNPYPYVIPVDPSMYGMMGPMAGYCPMPMMNGAMPLVVPPKVTKTFPNCTLQAPLPGAPVPTRRNRPNGCKTVFVGGLPEKITDDIIKEAFSDCGEISTVRMSKKNFCHIRFASEHMVDQAMFFSGYRLKIENKDDEPAYSSRIHVDYAIAKDDQYEYECMMRKKEEIQKVLRPPSPPPIVDYSECHAAILGESLRNEESFKQALNVLTTWLDRGECNKRNAGTFFSMIQVTYNRIRRLVAEKTKFEDELTAVEQKLHQQSTANAQHFMDIESMFNHASAQKVWDHFTKTQRKHIEQWKRQAADIKLQNLKDLMEERIEAEMEMSDSEDQKPPEELTEKKLELNEELAKVQEDKQKLQEDKQKLQEDKQNLQEDKQKLQEDKQKLQEDKQNLQEDKQKLQEDKQKLQEDKQKLQEDKQKLQEDKQKLQEDKQKLQRKRKKSYRKIAMQFRRISVHCRGVVVATVHLLRVPSSVPESEACLVSLIATFLIVHPLGASIDYICSYLQTMDRNINPRDVENVLKKFNTVFKEKSTGSTLEKKWIFFIYKFYTSPSLESIF